MVLGEITSEQLGKHIRQNAWNIVRENVRLEAFTIAYDNLTRLVQDKINIEINDIRYSNTL